MKAKDMFNSDESFHIAHRIYKSLQENLDSKATYMEELVGCLYVVCYLALCAGMEEDVFVKMCRVAFKAKKGENGVKK